MPREIKKNNPQMKMERDRKKEREKAGVCVRSIEGIIYGALGKNNTKDKSDS